MGAKQQNFQRRIEIYIHWMIQYSLQVVEITIRVQSQIKRASKA